MHIKVPLACRGFFKEQISHHCMHLQVNWCLQAFLFQFSSDLKSISYILSSHTMRMWRVLVEKTLRLWWLMMWWDVFSVGVSKGNPDVAKLPPYVFLYCTILPGLFIFYGNWLLIRRANIVWLLLHGGTITVLHYHTTWSYASSLSISDCSVLVHNNSIVLLSVLMSSLFLCIHCMLFYIKLITMRVWQESSISVSISVSVNHRHFCSCELLVHCSVAAPPRSVCGYQSPARILLRV